MAITHSTGARNGLCKGDHPIETAFSGGRLRLFTGAPPASPDNAETGTLLLSLLLPNPLFPDPAGGTLTANAISAGTCVGAGNATYFRLVSSTDSGGSSATDVRVQGSVGVAAADLILNSVACSVGLAASISALAYAAAA